MLKSVAINICMMYDAHLLQVLLPLLIFCPGFPPPARILGSRCVAIVVIAARAAALGAQGSSGVH
ncbi:MAG TPA: hypothetical protein V6D04_00900, partial [Candidatus Obscuribacterales bacterium]